MTRIVVLSDMQCPSHDVRAVEAVQQFVRWYKPDEILCVGDEADSPEPSQWEKGRAAEYGGTLQDGLDTTAQVMAGFRRALGKDKRFRVQRSNHTDRTEKYVRKYAPALVGIRNLDIERLLGYDKIGVEYVRTITEVAPGWVMAHGDESGLNRTAGGTALGLARRVGRSVVCGHTHKLGLQHESIGFGGRILQTLYGFEVGHLMSLKSAHYLSTGAANWVQGFGILQVDGKSVHPTPVPIVGGRFVVEGRSFEL